MAHAVYRFEFADGSAELVAHGSVRYHELVEDGHAPAGEVPGDDGISDALQAYLDGRTVPEGTLPTRLSAEELAADYGRPQPAESAIIANLPTPHYIGHRVSGIYSAPEYTRVGVEIADAYRIDVLEIDVRTLADGTLVLNHDSTVDRTTDGTGNVSDMTAQRWKQLTTDSAGMMGYGTWPSEAPMFLDEFLRLAGNTHAISAQVDLDVDLAAFDATVERCGVDKRTVQVCSFSDTRAMAAAALGYPASFITSLATTPDYAALAAGGVRDLCADATALTQQHVTDAHAAGLTVSVYTVNSRRFHDTLAVMGVDGFVSDDPAYLAGALPARKSDAFAGQAFLPGQTPTRLTRGKFYTPDSWGWDYSQWDVNYTRLGYIEPTDPSNFVLDFEMNIGQVAAVDKWGAISLVTDDRFNDNNGGAIAGCNGYNFIVRANNNLSIAKVLNNQWQAWLSNSIAVTGFTLGAWHPYRITVTPTTVRFERSDTGEGTTFSDATTRPLPYMLAGRSQSSVQLRNITIT